MGNIRSTPPSDALRPAMNSPGGYDCYKQRPGDRTCSGSRWRQIFCQFLLISCLKCPEYVQSPPAACRLSDFPVLSRYTLSGGASTQLVWILGRSSLERSRLRQLQEAFADPRYLGGTLSCLLLLLLLLDVAPITRQSIQLIEGLRSVNVRFD